MEQNKFWDTRSEKYDSEIKKRDAFFLKTIEKCKTLLSKNDKVLDFGCASGEYSIAFVDTINSIVGIDTSEKMIALANNKLSGQNHSNVKFFNINIMDTRLQPKSFSVILAFSVLHLVEDIEEVMKRLNDLLDEDGLILSQTPCLSERSFSFRFFVNGAQKIGLAPYIKSMKYTYLESTFTEQGFKLMESLVWDKRQSIRWIVATKNK